MNNCFVLIKHAFPFFVSLTFFVYIASCIFVGYLALRHFDEMIDALKNSRGIDSDKKNHYAKGFEHRCRVVLDIGWAISRSEAWVRSGKLSEKDMENFPVYLRRLLIAENYLLWTSFCILVVVSLILEFTEWSHR